MQTSYTSILCSQASYVLYNNLASVIWTLSGWKLGSKSWVSNRASLIGTLSPRDGSHDGFISFQLPLHHLDLQLFHLVGTLCPVLVLFCYEGIVEAVRSCIEILHNQISHISFVLARFVHRTFMTTIKSVSYTHLTLPTILRV